MRAKYKKVYFTQKGDSLSPVGKASQPSKKTAKQTSEEMDGQTDGADYIGPAASPVRRVRKDK